MALVVEKGRAHSARLDGFQAGYHRRSGFLASSSDAKGFGEIRQIDPLLLAHVANPAVRVLIFPDAVIL